MVGVSIDDSDNAICRNPNQDERKAEKRDKRQFSLDGHAGPQNDRNRENDKKKIRDHIANTHCDQLRMTLATTWSRIWDNLPILVERSAFRESCNYYSGESDHQKPSYELKTDLVRSPPSLANKTFEELGHSEFGDPQAGSKSDLFDKIQWEDAWLTTPHT